jgi:alpha-ketoglutarate-dependent taurine dioxygenase
VDQRIAVEDLYKAMMTWGDPSRAMIHEYIVEKFKGRHWREILINLGYISNEVGEEMLNAVSVVSYKKGEKGRPAGIFQNGELDWHSDQCSVDDGQRMIGLQSISDTANSQTQFLCTHDAYESLSSDMKSMVKELYVKHKWVDGAMAPGLNKLQTNLIHYNMVPLDGMETRLYRETATGLPGLKMPPTSFDGFAGMSMDESNRVINEIKRVVYKDDYVYTQDWIDGQTVFMDQEITLHKRPTNIKDGDLRTMSRCISYLNKLYPDSPAAQRLTHIRYKGQMLTKDEFATLVDADRKRRFELEQQGRYASLDSETAYIGADTKVSDEV